jgi:trans-aconitate methyltransferase
LIRQWMSTTDTRSKAFNKRQAAQRWNSPSGIDFSAEMLAKAQAKLPHSILVQADLLSKWPMELQRPFDRVVSAYVFHEFDLETKVRLLHRIATHHLIAGGRIVVAGGSNGSGPGEKKEMIVMFQVWVPGNQTK